MVKKIVTDIKELRKPCAEVLPDEDISAIILDLKDTLNTQKGIGLAANQIGINKKIAYYKFGENEVTLINPRIIEKWDRIVFAEGCLSFPGLEIKTDRYLGIMFENSGNKFEAGYLEAMIIQHEVDHLNGITILDRKHKAR